MTELETYNDGLARIQGCIRKSLTVRISRLKDISTTIKLGHFQHLLGHIDALGRIQEHLPKMLETIEIATSLSAYSPAAAMLIRLRAYHGDNFDLQRLILPLHLNGQDYARIRNAIDPLAHWLQTLHKDTEYVRINVHSAQESVKRNVSYPGLKLPDADAVR